MDFQEVLYKIFLYGSLIIVTLLYIGYRYLKSKHEIWKEIGVQKSLTFHEYLYTVVNAFRLDIKDIDEMYYPKYKKVYGSYLFHQPILMISDPEIIKNVWVKDFNTFQSSRRFEGGEETLNQMLTNKIGEDWKRMRSIVSPTFTSGMIRKMAHVVRHSSNVMCENIDQSIKTNSVLDVKKLAGCLTMDVIASAAFGTKIDTFKDPNNAFNKHGSMFFNTDISLNNLVIFTLPKVSKFLKLRFAPVALDFFKKILKQILKEREKMSSAPHDLLQFLIDAGKNKLPIENEDEVPEIKETNKIHKYLTEDEILSQSLLFFIAGFDTVATTIAHTCYMMALDPEIQERLHEEIDVLFEEKDELTFDDVNNVQYLDCCVNETLRLLPPAMRVERLAYEDYEIKEYGIKVPKGMHVDVPVYMMHRDPDFYPDPETFDPDRFLPENKAKRNPYVYMPFGAGPRNCVAQRFALMEVKMALTYLFKNFRFYRVDETKVPLDYFKQSGLLSPREVKLGIESRTK